MFRVREFKFNPFVADDKTPATGCVGVQDSWQELNTSVWNCDGEVLNEPSITARYDIQFFVMILFICLHDFGAIVCATFEFFSFGFYICYDSRFILSLISFL